MPLFDYCKKAIWFLHSIRAAHTNFIYHVLFSLLCLQAKTWNQRNRFRNCFWSQLKNDKILCTTVNVKLQPTSQFLREKLQRGQYGIDNVPRKYSAENTLDNAFHCYSSFYSLFLCCCEVGGGWMNRGLGFSGNLIVADGEIKVTQVHITLGWVHEHKSHRSKFW